MLDNQKSLFELDESVTFLNCAYMSPQLRSVTKIGIEHLRRKVTPNTVTDVDFFTDRVKLKKKFAHLIGVENYQSIAIIPSVSYGIASVANNIVLKSTDEILICESQFPSHVYSWRELIKKNGGKIVTVSAPELSAGRADRWNKAILESINKNTAVVALPQVHWSDGSLFDLKAIREKSFEVGAKLVIDGTQSVGALPFDVAEIQPDALICGGYKWLMGPYGMGLAYFAESFWEGEPIEHNWLNRKESEDFSKLAIYQDEYQPGAERYSVGGSSNFMMVAMLTAAIEQVIEWKQTRIQEYCKSITESGIARLQEKGCFIEEVGKRSDHLFGVYLPSHLDKELIKRRLKEAHIFVSVRGSAIRVAPHVYNSQEDFDKFVNCIY